MMQYLPYAFQYEYITRLGGINNFMDGIDVLGKEGWEVVRIIPFSSTTMDGWFTSFCVVLRRLKNEAVEKQNA